VLLSRPVPLMRGSCWSSMSLMVRQFGISDKTTPGNATGCSQMKDA